MSNLVLFSEVMFFWCLATATPHLDLRWNSWKSGVAPLAVFGPATRAGMLATYVLLAGWRITTPMVLLASLAASTSFGLCSLRGRALEKGLLGELELASLAVFSFSAAMVIRTAQLEVGFPFLHVEFSEKRLATLYFMAAGAVFAVWASGNIVRGVLQKSGVLPTNGPTRHAGHEASNEGNVTAEHAGGSGPLRHGRLIGYLERLLLLVLVVRGSYEGLGFLIAAKGLIRSKDFENRALAEYFLVGNLLSVVCALAIGLSIRYALDLLW